MSSRKQVKANRENAKKSTGPKTPEGKAASSHNAIKHGLSTTLACLPGEDKLEYLSFSSSMASHFTPVKGDEEHLLQLMIDSAWRLRRASQYECTIFEQSGDDIDLTLKRLNILSSHEIRISNIYFKTRVAFTTSQIARVKQQSSDGGHMVANAEKFDASKHIPRLEGFDAKRSQLISSIDDETTQEYDRLDAAQAIRTAERLNKEAAKAEAAKFDLMKKQGQQDAEDAVHASPTMNPEIEENRRRYLKIALENGFDMGDPIPATYLPYLPEGYQPKPPKK